jgi:subtilisin family serine protease
VVIMTEMVHDARIVRMGATQHKPPQVRPWFGDSIGHWEGDTLVVETTNINPKQTAASGGLGPYRGASDKLKVTERFTRVGPDVINYKFTVEDPDTFTAPYSGELPFNRVKENVYEYACSEGNYALRAMLAGARKAEQEQAEQKKQ